jgi:hypothetical protein
MHVNYSQQADRARVPEFTTCTVPALTGDPLYGRHIPDKRQPHRADGAVFSRSRIMGLTRFLGVILILPALSAPIHSLSAVLPPGQSVTLAWDPSPDPGVVGYNMYYGVASRTYTNVVNPGNAMSVTISGLVEGRTYFFAATAYNILGMESELSNEASYTVPGTIPGALAKLQVHVAPAGQIILTVAGEVGHTYNIQASSDYITWTVIGTVTVPAGGSVDFTDTNAARFPNRLYRAQ